MDSLVDFDINTKERIREDAAQNCPRKNLNIVWVSCVEDQVSKVARRTKWWVKSGKQWLIWSPYVLPQQSDWRSPLNTAWWVTVIVVLTMVGRSRTFIWRNYRFRQVSVSFTLGLNGVAQKHQKKSRICLKMPNLSNKPRKTHKKCPDLPKSPRICFFRLSTLSSFRPTLVLTKVTNWTANYGDHTSPGQCGP